MHEEKKDYKPGIAIGTLNADTTVSVTGSTFINCQAGDQGKYIYESDTDVTGYLNANKGNVTNKGKIIVNTTASDASALSEALANGDNVVLTNNLKFSAKDTTANSGYGATGVVVNGGVFDGNGKTLTVDDAWNTWDCAVNAKGGTIKNLTINSAMRGIFMGSATADVYIDNVVIDGTVYTFNSDGGNKDYGVYISNSTLNGWTSFSDVHKEVVFTNCNFGEGGGYAFCRPYNVVTFKNCAFETGYVLDISKTTGIVLDNCTIGGVTVTADNINDLIGGEENAHLVSGNVTIK